MKHRGLKTEGRERFQLNPQGEKKCLKMCHELEKPFSDGECFLAENNLKGNATARWALLTTDFDWNQPCKIGRKMNKESIDPGRLYRVRKLVEIC